MLGLFLPRKLKAMPPGKSKVVFKRPSKSVLSIIRGATERNFTSFIETVEEVAKELTPIDLGHNRSSIHVEGKWSRIGLLFQMRAFTTSGYGAFLELGTSRKSSTFYPGAYITGKWRPYFKPAIEVAAKELEARSKRDWE